MSVGNAGPQSAGQLGQQWPGVIFLVTEPIQMLRKMWEHTGSLLRAGLLTLFPNASSWNCSSWIARCDRLLFVGGSAWMYYNNKANTLTNNCLSKSKTAYVVAATLLRTYRVPITVEGELCNGVLLYSTHFSS